MIFEFPSKPNNSMILYGQRSHLLKIPAVIIEISKSTMQRNVKFKTLRDTAKYFPTHLILLIIANP